jgi:hypothetical protein
VTDYRSRAVALKQQCHCNHQTSDRKHMLELKTVGVMWLLRFNVMADPAVLKLKLKGHCCLYYERLTEVVG